MTPAQTQRISSLPAPHPRRSPAQIAVAEADRLLGATKGAIGRALQALVLTYVEVDTHDRGQATSKVWLYPHGETLKGFEPEYVLDRETRYGHEADSIGLVFGEGPSGDKRLSEFYRLFRLAEAVGALDALRSDGGVIRLMPSVNLTAAQPMQGQRAA